MNVYDLNEQIAIVTGGSEGIGLAVVNRILALGGAVSIWVRDRPLLEETVKRIAKSDRVQGLGVEVADLAVTSVDHRKRLLQRGSPQIPANGDERRPSIVG